MQVHRKIPELRVRVANQRPFAADRAWVVYWMTAFRRTHYNFALQHARDLALELKKPLVILEAVRIRYRWASDRLHRFIIDGMADNASALKNSPAYYYPYVEPEAGAGSGLLHELAKQAAVVVTDDFPCFFHPTLLATVAPGLPSRLEVVDSNGLIPLRAAERTFTVAHSYRRWMQKNIAQHLDDFPEESPLDEEVLKLPSLNELPSGIVRRWPPADLQKWSRSDALQRLPIEHAVVPTETHGGPSAAQRQLRKFITGRLDDYDRQRNEPDEAGSSELSPYLHFGHLAAHQIFWEVMRSEDWNPGKLSEPNGKVNGFWGVASDAEAFLDQFCTWREIGFNMCWREKNFDRYESLPRWALETLEEHAQDPRPVLYSVEELEAAETHDPIWNASQRQLVSDGRIHNYMRMLWGKKILEWTESPPEALRIMLELNNKYALDGRDPNSYSGIFWVLGRYDRAWGPERKIFGKVRYMSSENTAKKHRLGQYLQHYSSWHSLARRISSSRRGGVE